jgi:hypothetical protein
MAYRIKPKPTQTKLSSTKFRHSKIVFCLAFPYSEFDIIHLLILCRFLLDGVCIKHLVYLLLEFYVTVMFSLCAIHKEGLCLSSGDNVSDL